MGARGTTDSLLSPAAVVPAAACRAPPEVAAKCSDTRTRRCSRARPGTRSSKSKPERDQLHVAAETSGSFRFSALRPSRLSCSLKAGPEAF